MKLNNIRILEIIESIKNTDLFNIATTHKSFLKTNPNLRSYEELIPFGDEILDTFITAFLENLHNNDIKLKDLDKIKSELVDIQYLKNITENISLNNFIKSKIKVFSPTKISTFKSFLVALYFQKDPVILFEFLSLTVLNKPEFLDKFQDFDPNLVPEIRMKGIVETIINSSQITDTYNLTDNKLPIQNLAPISIPQNFNENLHDKNFANSSESEKILEQLTNLELKIKEQILNLESIKNNLKTSEPLNPVKNSEIDKVAKNLEELSKTKIIAKTSFIFFNLFLLLTVVSSLILYFNYSDVFPDDSSFQLLNKLSNKVIKAKFNSENKQVNSTENKQVNSTENKIEISGNKVDNLESKVDNLESKQVDISENEINIPIFNNSLTREENFQILEKVRSLYVKENEVFNILPILEEKLMTFNNPNIENKIIIEDKPSIENNSTNEVKQEGSLVNLMFAGFGIIVLYQLQKFAIFALIKYPLSFLNNTPKVGIDAEIPDQIEITSRTLDPAFVSQLIEKSKVVIDIGAKYLDEIGKIPAIDIITANIFGILFYLLDPLEEPLEKPKDVDTINYESPFENYSDYKIQSLEDYNKNINSDVNEDNDSNISEDSFDISDYIETQNVTVEISIEEEVEQMDQSTQTGPVKDYEKSSKSLRKLVVDLENKIESQEEIISDLQDKLNNQENTKDVKDASTQKPDEQDLEQERIIMEQIDKEYQQKILEQEEKSRLHRLKEKESADILEQYYNACREQERLRDIFYEERSKEIQDIAERSNELNDDEIEDLMDKITEQKYDSTAFDNKWNPILEELNYSHRKNKKED